MNEDEPQSSSLKERGTAVANAATAAAADHQEQPKKAQEATKAKIPVLVQLHSNKPRVKSHTTSTDHYNDNDNSSSGDDDDEDRMDLEVGENWLRLVLVNRTATNGNADGNDNDNDSHGGKQTRKQQKFILDDTQETTTTAAAKHHHSNSSSAGAGAGAVVPYPSIFSGVVPNGGSKDCYLMFDVDDSCCCHWNNNDNDKTQERQMAALTIKDMRPPLNDGNDNDNDNDSDEEEKEEQQQQQKPWFEICLARRRRKKQQDESTKTKASTSTSHTLWAEDDDDIYEYGPLETLPRRQLRILQPGDRICTRAVVSRNNDNSNNSNDTLGLVLEYRLVVPSSSSSSSPSFSYGKAGGFATQADTMPEDTQATTFSAPPRAVDGFNNNNNNSNDDDDNDYDDDDDTEMEEQDEKDPTNSTTNTNAKPTTTTKAIGPITPTKLEIMEGSSNEEDEKDQQQHQQQKQKGEMSGTMNDDADANAIADPALTQPEEGGLAQTIESEEEDNDNDDDEEQDNNNQENKEKDTPTTPGSSSVAFLATQPQRDDVNDDDDDDDSDATEFDQDDTKVHDAVEDEKAKRDPPKKEEEISIVQDNTNNKDIAKVADNTTDKEESSEAKTTQETEGSAKTSSKEAAAAKQESGPATTSKDSTSMEDLKDEKNALNDEGADATQDVAKRTSPKDGNNSNTPGMKVAEQDDEDATNEAKGDAIVADDDADATQDMAQEIAPEDNDATQDMKKIDDEDAPVGTNANLKQAPVKKEPEDIDEVADKDKCSKMGADNIEENKENELVSMADAESTSAVQPKNEEAETDDGKSRIDNSELEINVGERKKMPTPSDGTPAETSGTVTSPEVAKGKSRKKQKQVKKYGTPRKRKDVTNKTVESAYPDSDNSCSNPQKPSKTGEKRSKRSKDEVSDIPEEMEDIKGDGASAGETAKGVMKGEGDREEDEPATPVQSKSSPKMDSSQARKVEGASILASLVKEEASTAPQGSNTTKPTKKPTRVKRKKLGSVPEFPDESSFDHAVPTANLTLSNSSGSPDSGSDPTKKRRAKSRKTSPAPAAAAPSELSQAIETPARSTRKRNEAKSVSDSKTVSKRARTTPIAEGANDAEDKDTNDRDDEVRVVTTGVTLTKTQINVIKNSLGGVLLEDVMDAPTATHVIAGDKKVPMRRTPKLMIGLCCTSNIVSLEWLTKSGKAKKALPAEDFLLVDDKVAEEKYDFSMQESLQRGKAMRQNDEKLLAGWWVHVLKGVSGNKAPPEKEMKLIVEVAGGEWLPTLTKKSLEGVDMTRLLVISSDPETKKQVSTKAVQSALEDGARKRTTSWLFGCIMRQKLDFPTTS